MDFFYSNKIFLFENLFFIRKNFLIKSIFLFGSTLFRSTQNDHTTQKVVQSPKFLEVIF